MSLFHASRVTKRTEDASFARVCKRATRALARKTKRTLAHDKAKLADEQVAFAKEQAVFATHVAVITDRMTTQAEFATFVNSSMIEKVARLEGRLALKSAMVVKADVILETAIDKKVREYNDMRCIHEEEMRVEKRNSAMLTEQLANANAELEKQSAKAADDLLDLTSKFVKAQSAKAKANAKGTACRHGGKCDRKGCWFDHPVPNKGNGKHRGKRTPK